MKLLKIIIWNKNEKTIYHEFIDDKKELELRRVLEDQKNGDIIDKYAIQEVCLHMVHDITELKGLSLADLRKLILYDEKATDNRTAQLQPLSSNPLDNQVFTSSAKIINNANCSQIKTNCYSTKEV